MMPPRMLTPMCSFSAPVALPPHAVIELEDRRSVDELTQDALVIPLRYEPFQNDSNRWSDTTMFTFRSHVRSNSHRLPAIAETSPSPAWHSQVTLHETEEPMNWEGFLIAHPIPPPSRSRPATEADAIPMRRTVETPQGLVDERPWRRGC
ncbi:hypothetical protein EX30DRAFT_341101 [Ascodesmis nigricans]|uniref:Uncharacterized protein n=1 Tax=Ascodesmis nigricans TaxID=341454 RepID=A0A4S2MWY3_9PEZI|nr:hypothetical protein EX30DRAFT_341101 [Ascodesmis nigricans]